MRASAPGKIILSGEHSVVYSAPAILSAISLRTSCLIEKSSNSAFSISLINLNQQYRLSAAELNNLLEQVLTNYQQFLTSGLPIAKVLRDPVMYPAVVLALFLKKFAIKDPQAAVIEITSEIPIGSGLGSSSALTLALLRACYGFYNIEMNPPEFLALAQQAESFHSGKPSGADNAASFYGGTLKFKTGKVTEISGVNMSFNFIHTGMPEASTGETVMRVAKGFSESSDLWNNFIRVTADFEQALNEADLDMLTNAIRRNHELLVKIGVVPVKIQQFVAELENTGGAAKVCGAGSVSGDSAGVIMAVGKSVPELARKYSFKILDFNLNETGIRID